MSVSNFRIMESGLIKIYQSPLTVLTAEEIAILWNETSSNNLYAKIQYYVKRGSLVRLRRGIFAKNENFNYKELATKILTPSYIGFETALREAGMIFQHYDNIFVASYTSKHITVGKNTFVFRKIRDETLYNANGIITVNNVSQATPERAFLDMIYLYPHYYFDNLDTIKWKVCMELAPLYNNKQLIKRVERYRKKYAE